MGESANGRRFYIQAPLQSPQIMTQQQQGFRGREKAPSVLAAGTGSSGVPGQCPHTTGSPRRKPVSSAAGSDKPMMDSKKQTPVSPGGEKWGASQLSRVSDTFREV